MGRAEPFGHDALATELTSGTIDRRAVLLEMLIQDEAQMRALERLGQQMPFGSRLRRALLCPIPNPIVFQFPRLPHLYRSIVFQFL